MSSDRYQSRTLVLILYALVFGLVLVITMLYLIILSISNGFVVRVHFNAIGEGWAEVGLLFALLILFSLALVRGFRLAQEAN